tara:strand:- start:498 stop:626 length:129 start_codon:yes stop_codon:yes gene_type:complete
MIVSFVKGRNVMNPIICVISKEMVETYIGHIADVGFLPEKYL